VCVNIQTMFRGLVIALLADGCAAWSVPTSTSCNRRAFIGTSSAALFSPAASRAEDTIAPPITRMDAFQLKASYNGLEDALAAWRVEVAQVQLGNEPSSVVAVAGLADVQLKRLAESGSSAAVEEFKQRRGGMLQFLYLARGAARYERDPSVALDYIAKAKTEAEGARDALGLIAATQGIDLLRPRRTAPAVGAPEDAIRFEPRKAPNVESRFTL
jgi:hypothetical protein